MQSTAEKKKIIKELKDGSVRMSSSLRSTVPSLWAGAHSPEPLLQIQKPAPLFKHIHEEGRSEQGEEKHNTGFP